MFGQQPILARRTFHPGKSYGCCYRAGITNCVDHVSDGGTAGSRVLCELISCFHPKLSASCVAEDWRFGDRFHVGLHCGCPCLQLACSWSAPRATRWGKEITLILPSVYHFSCNDFAGTGQRLTETTEAWLRHLNLYTNHQKNQVLCAAGNSNGN